MDRRKSGSLDSGYESDGSASKVDSTFLESFQKLRILERFEVHDLNVQTLCKPEPFGIQGSITPNHFERQISKINTEIPLAFEQKAINASFSTLAFRNYAPPESYSIINARSWKLPSPHPGAVIERNSTLPIQSYAAYEEYSYISTVNLADTMKSNLINSVSSFQRTAIGRYSTLALQNYVPFEGYSYISAQNPPQAVNSFNEPKISSLGPAVNQPILRQYTKLKFLIHPRRIARFMKKRQCTDIIEAPQKKPRLTFQKNLHSSICRIHRIRREEIIKQELRLKTLQCCTLLNIRGMIPHEPMDIEILRIDMLSNSNDDSDLNSLSDYVCWCDAVDFDTCTCVDDADAIQSAQPLYM